jgi:O-antigen/teichoic acid export membrane protein
MQLAGDRVHMNTAWNLLGLAAPLLFAAFAVPRLLGALGADAFGLLTLTWSLIGYFSLLDLGLGRALAQLTAAGRASSRQEGIPAAFWTSLALMALAGIVGGTALACCADGFAGVIAGAQPGLRAEARQCLYLIGASIPLLTVSAALRGFLEAHGRFAWISASRVGLGLLTFVVPVLLLPFSPRVAVMAGSLALARLLVLVVYFWLCLSAMPSVWNDRRVDRKAARALLRLGSWMTVSNVISALMTYFDRFLLAAVLSVGAVAYYTTAFEAITKLLLVPAALAGVLFPTFSGALVSDPRSAKVLYRRSLFQVVVILLPLAAIAAGFGKAGLAMWLGSEVALRTSYVVPMLALGVLANGLAGVPFSLIQAAGRPDLTAKLHLAEAPVYFAACWFLTSRYGIDGAALAWTGRVLIDALALLAVANRWAPLERMRAPWHTAAGRAHGGGAGAP